ncbi:MAG: hypothetical protein PPP55_03010 [Halorubrum sp.]
MQPQTVLRTGVVLVTPFGTVLSMAPDLNLPRPTDVLNEYAN